MYLTFLKTLELRYIFIRWSYVWKWRENYISFLFVIVIFLIRYNYVIYLFDAVTFFNDVRNRYYFGTFKLRMEITLQLRFGFAPHCNIFFITTFELRFNWVRSKITYENYVIKRSCFSYVCLQLKNDEKNTKLLRNLLSGYNHNRTLTSAINYKDVKLI